MIIDGHGHACGVYLTLENIRETLSKSGADQVVLTAGEWNSKTNYSLPNTSKKFPKKDIVNEYNKVIGIITKCTGAVKKIPQGNEYVYSLKQQAPELIKQYYWITKNTWQQIETDYARMQFEGVKLHQCWESFDISSNWFEEIAAWTIAKDLPLFIHIHDYKQVGKIIDFIKEHPKAIIIVAHMYGAEFYLEQDLKCLENIYFDISNSMGISAERIMAVHKKLGSTKLVLGSDIPYGKNALKNTIECINQLHISSTEKDNILGQNLKTLLKIK